ncbi:MAG TPA: flagellar biosynthetic protein FliQ [bacterium]|nr:flagellar biosynthetic protein FliQ [bacterium]HQL61743.1 flagellar biosynthetic protein FliQ [bacterium]
MQMGISMELVIQLGQEMLYNSLLIAFPMLGVALVVGVLISIVQAATQVNEQTLTIVPKLVIVGAVMVFCMPWILNVLIGYTINLFNMMPMLIGD